MKKYTADDIENAPYYSKYNFIWDMMPKDEILIQCNAKQIQRIRASIAMTLKRHNSSAKFITRKNWDATAYLIIRVK